MDFGNRKISNLCPFLKQPFPVEGNVQFLDFEFVQNTKLTSSAFGVKILRVCFRAYSTKICIFHEIGNITQKQKLTRKHDFKLGNIAFQLETHKNNISSIYVSK